MVAHECILFQAQPVLYPLVGGADGEGAENRPFAVLCDVANWRRSVELISWQDQQDGPGRTPHFLPDWLHLHPSVWALTEPIVQLALRAKRYLGVWMRHSPQSCRNPCRVLHNTAWGTRADSPIMGAKGEDC